MFRVTPIMTGSIHMFRIFSHSSKLGEENKDECMNMTMIQKQVEDESVLSLTWLNQNPNCDYDFVN